MYRFTVLKMLYWMITIALTSNKFDLLWLIEKTIKFTLIWQFSCLSCFFSLHDTYVHNIFKCFGTRSLCPQVRQWVTPSLMSIFIAYLLFIGCLFSHYSYATLSFFFYLNCNVFLYRVWCLLFHVCQLGRFTRTNWASRQDEPLDFANSFELSAVRDNNWGLV